MSTPSVTARLHYWYTQFFLLNVILLVALTAYLDVYKPSHGGGDVARTPASVTQAGVPTSEGSK